MEKKIHKNIVRQKFRKTYYKYEYLYPKRNNVEGIFSSLKRTILAKITSKNFMTKKREVAFKIIIYNLKKNIFYTFFLIRNFINFDKKLVILTN